MACASLRFKLPWWFRLSWRQSKLMTYLFAIELPITIAALVLFGLADPDAYRTILWKEGSSHGWSSDPSALLYAYANYRPVKAPSPFNPFTTTFNVVISILTLFIYLVKIVMYITKLFPPFHSAFVHAGVLALWLTSLAWQAGPDNIDPDVTAQFPWYLTRGCGAPVSARAQSGCKQAIGSFVVTIIMSLVMVVYIGVSIRFSIPNEEQRTKARMDAEEEAALADDSPISYYNDKHFEVEMNAYGDQLKSPTFAHVPVTPRTEAFNALEGKRVGAPQKVHIKRSSHGQPMQTNKDLPLRHHISMGEETYDKTRFA